MDYLARMQSAAQRMETLVTDLLDFARITSRAKPFTPVDLGEQVGGVVADLDVQIKETGRESISALCRHSMPIHHRCGSCFRISSATR